jgi:hypothetical protein
MNSDEMKIELTDSQSDTQGGVHSSKIGIWYDSTSIASALSSSAWSRKSSMSLASDLCICSLPAEAGVKAIIVLPTGISRGMSIISLWLAGTSIVCSIVIRPTYHEKPKKTSGNAIVSNTIYIIRSYE